MINIQPIKVIKGIPAILVVVDAVAGRKGQRQLRVADSFHARNGVRLLVSREQPLADLCAAICDG